MKIEIVNGEKAVYAENPSFELSEIPRVLSDDLTYNQFFDEFMSTNTPVIIKSIQIKTELSEKWFQGDELRLESMAEDIKNHDVPVANCSKQYFDSHEKSQMPFGDYVNYWNKSSEAGDCDLYLKDFHLKQELGLDFYNIPFYFASDWLNEYLIDLNKDDYRFIYIGPKKTWTPFHSDVFGSFSWSSNMAGRKHWLILPPNEEQKLRDHLGNLPFSITRDLLDRNNAKYFDLIQDCDETFFVPSKWFHQVENIENSVSVNHNWFNGCNVNHVLNSLISHYKDVEKEISDCRDMDNFTDHCQLMLKSSFGMNFNDFLEILTHIADKRIKALRDGSSFHVFEMFTFGVNHAIFDLKAILQVLHVFKENHVIGLFGGILDLINELIGKIKEIVIK